MRVLAAMLLAQVFYTTQGPADRLERAERMTPAEVQRLRDAEGQVAKAQTALDDVRASIAKAHTMKAEYWMEWSTSVRFDGEFLLFYRDNHHMGLMH